MIEARFDDLVAGAERAFRLVEPVGVIEARRPSEVAGAIDAAGVIRFQGAVGGGVRGVRGGARPRPRALGARASAGRSLRGAAARVVRAVRTQGRPPAARTRPARPLRIGGFALAPERRSSDLRRDRRTDPRADRRRAHLSGEPHDPAPGDDPGRRARVLPGPVPRAARRVRGVPGPGALPRALGVAGAVLPGRRRPHHDAPDEGHRAARPLAGRGRGDRSPPRGLVEGPRRERDDRGPAPQRPGPDLPDGFGRGGTDARTRALRDRVAAHLDDRGRPASRDHADRHVPRPVPERIGHGRAQGAHHEDHRGPRGLGPRPVLRRDRLPRAAGVRRAARELQRRDPNGGPGRPDPHGRVRRRRRHHPRLVGGRASTRRSWRRRAS